MTASALESSATDDRRYDRLALAVLAVLAIAIAVIFRGYGISWDEPVQNAYGKMSLNYYLTLGADQSSFKYLNLYWYGALFDTLAAAANKFLPFAEYDTRHLLNAIVGLIGLAGVWRLTRTLGGARAGFIATLLLALTPLWFGNSFINPKDIPFAAAMTWATAFLVAMARDLPRWRWRDVVGFGVAAGAALGTRVGGLIIIAYLVAMFAAFVPLRLLDRRPVSTVRRELTGFIAPGLTATAIAILVMYLCWPWAQHNPITGPLEAFRSFSRFPIWLEYPYFGTIIESTNVPPTYIPGMLVVMLPELTIAGALAALLLGLASLLPGPGIWLSRLPYLVLALTIIFPPAYAAATRAVLFDGIRHMIFIVPPLTAAAALAIDRIWTAHPIGRAVMAALLLATVAAQTILVVRSHPYQYLVFNLASGGVPGAAGRFELDYWGVTFREAVALMQARLQEQGVKPVDGRPWRVSVCGPEATAELFFPPSFALWPRQRIVEADFHITHTRYQCPLGPYLISAPELAVVRRFDTPLAYVYDLREHNRRPYLPNPPAP
jgi:hypothetical protein